VPWCQRPKFTRAGIKCGGRLRARELARPSPAPREQQRRHAPLFVPSRPAPGERGRRLLRVPTPPTQVSAELTLTRRTHCRPRTLPSPVRAARAFAQSLRIAQANRPCDRRRARARTARPHDGEQRLLHGPERRVRDVPCGRWPPNYPYTIYAAPAQECDTRLTIMGLPCRRRSGVRTACARSRSTTSHGTRVCTSAGIPGAASVVGRRPATGGGVARTTRPITTSGAAVSTARPTRCRRDPASSAVNPLPTAGRACLQRGV
jgi:hypothetical protein